ncbi:MAG: DedA family protein [Pseudomonadales bacterium]|nr:DedA family protein [Pseudomonadales bacterium]
MNIITYFVDFILHLDKHLGEIIAAYGSLTYAIFFAIIFAETGLVIFPFLPGDSLLFAAGTFTALGSLHFFATFLILFVAAVVGDSVNYWIGNIFGKKIVDNPKITFINQEHIDKTEAFYKKYGGKTIILARFVPIIRTFAPFVAGVGKMDYQKFITYNVLGGFAWVGIFMTLGYFFGNVQFVKDHFSVAILAIIAISVLPMLFEYIKHKNSPSVPIKILEKDVNK